MRPSRADTWGRGRGRGKGEGQGEGEVTLYHVLITDVRVCWKSNSQRQKYLDYKFKAVL